MIYTKSWRLILLIVIISIAIPINVLAQESNEYAAAMQMLQLVNNARATNNVRPLCLSNKLVRSATSHAAYEASINTMTHDGPLSLSDRFTKQGYQPASVAENVGFTSTPFTQVVFDIWMSSAEHRANILDPNYVHFGSASSQGTNGMYFWTQLFAKPADMNAEPCGFSAASDAANLSPGQPGFDPNGIYGANPNGSNGNSPGSGSSGNCFSIDNGIGGKSLSCKMNSRYPANSGSGVGINTNPFFGSNGSIVNPPGYEGSNCAVVSTSPAPDGQGSVRVIKCTSNSSNNMPNSNGPMNNNFSQSNAGYNSGGNNYQSGVGPTENSVSNYNAQSFNSNSNNIPLNNNPNYYSAGYNQPPNYNPTEINNQGYNSIGPNSGYSSSGYNNLNNNYNENNQSSGYNPIGNNPGSYNSMNNIYPRYKHERCNSMNNNIPNPVTNDPNYYNSQGFINNPPGSNYLNNPSGYNSAEYSPGYNSGTNNMYSNYNSRP